MKNVLLHNFMKTWNEIYRISGNEIKSEQHKQIFFLLVKNRKIMRELGT